MGVAEGVDLHTVVLVDFRHLTVLRKAVQCNHSDLLGGVGPSDKKADGDGAEEKANGASDHCEPQGHRNERNSDEEADEANAKTGGDVFAPRGGEGLPAGLEGVADALTFQNQVRDHEEGHDPPSEATKEVND